MDDEKKIASEKIAACLALALRSIKEAEKIATEAGVDFNWGGPHYGMGGYFNGSKDWNDSACYGENDESRWNSSSQNC